MTDSSPGPRPATVARSDDEGIELLLDDGTRQLLPAGAGLGARQARRGQRVELVGQGEELRVQLPKVPLAVCPGQPAGQPVD